MGCKCDAGYDTADCSGRQCKSGVDPLYTDDNTVVDYVASYSFVAAATDTLGGSYALKIYDSFGEDYVTGDLSLTDECASIDRVLAALPNNAGDGISCTSSTVAGDANAAYTQAVSITFKNSGARKHMEVVEYLDGLRSSVLVTGSSATLAYTLNEWTNTIGMSTDYFATKCAGVTVDVLLSADWNENDGSGWATGTDATDGSIPRSGAVGYVKASSSIINTLKACLGDADGDATNNVEIYNWDYGSVSIGATPTYYVGSHPHAIKVADSSGQSDHVLVWWDAGANANFQLKAVNAISASKFGAEVDPAGTVRSLSVYTTSGVVTQLARDWSATTHSNAHGRDGILTANHNETKLAGYFAKYSNKIYTNFDGSCETGDSLVHSCVEKGDMLFVVDGCWGGGDPAMAKTEVFGGATMSCASPSAATTGTGMLYTVTKIYTQDWSGNTTAYDVAQYGPSTKGKEDRFVIEVDHNLAWDGSEIGNPDNSVDQSGVDQQQLGAGFSGLVVLFKFVPAADGTDYTYYSECSNRGSSDSDSGLCSCFKGYTGDDCSSQNALAGI
jgi:hypothetical protein